MDKDTRSAIERATQAARSLLEADYGGQLEGTYDLLLSGEPTKSQGKDLRGRPRVLREKIVAAIEHKRAAGMSAAEAVLDFRRDAAFTTLNRFVALKMLEARELVLECISKGEQSAGYREFCGLAKGLPLLPGGAGYRLYLECLFDELSTEVKVLFDRRDAASILWPRRQTLAELIDLWNAADLASVWREDETIGWVYQYFNSQAERREMRDKSQAPRNSRELAVRNQFFTPRYVVQFLTDNTLGRTWYEMRSGDTVLTDRCEYLVRRPDEVELHALDSEDVQAAKKWLQGDDVPEPGLWALAHTVNGYDRHGDGGEREGEPDWHHRTMDRLASGQAGELSTQDLLDVLFLLCRGERFSEGTLDAAKREIDAALAELRTRVAKAREGGSGAEALRAPAFYDRREKKDPRDLRILDPACGSGHFLLYAFDLLLAMYEEAWADPESPASAATGHPLSVDYDLPSLRKEAPGLILRHNLHGVDIDPRCAQIAALALWMRAQRAFQEAGVARGERPRIAKTNIVVAEPMPGEKDLVDDFAASLKPPVLGELFKTIVDKMKLAGELGSLLPIETDVEDAVARARKEYQREMARQREESGYLPGMAPPVVQKRLADYEGLTDDGFFDNAEGIIHDALAKYAETAAGAQGTRRRLFAEDAAHGVAFVEVMRRKYDVVLMNPPFGSGSAKAKAAFEKAYPRTKNDVYAAFVERGISASRRRATLGAITSRTGFFLARFQRWREEVILDQAPPVVFADLGHGVLDSAMVETAAYALEVKS